MCDIEMKNLVWKIWGGKLDKTQDKVKWHTIMLMLCQDDLGMIASKRRGGLRKFYL